MPLVTLRPGAPYTPTAAQQDEAASRLTAQSAPRRPGEGPLTLFDMLKRRDSTTKPGAQPFNPFRFVMAPAPVVLPRLSVPAPLVDPTMPPPAVPVTAAEPRTEIPALGRPRPRRPRTLLDGGR